MNFLNQDLNYQELKIKEYCSEIQWEDIIQEGTENLVVAPTGSGKALRDEDYIFTTTGRKKVKDVIKGDFLFGDDGYATEVVAVHPQDKEQEEYQLLFEDGRSEVCSEHHLWQIVGKKESINTKKLFNLQYSEELYVPINKPIASKYVIDTSDINPLKLEEVEKIAGEPHLYLTISERKQLLLELYVNFEKVVRQEKISLNVAKQLVINLARSLGYIVSFYKEYGFEFKGAEKLRIISITKLNTKSKMTCFEVDNESHCFLTGKYTVTHNSHSLIAELSKRKNIAVCSPFVVLNEQFMDYNHILRIEVGTKTRANSVLPENGIITSFHSIPRLLEIEGNLEFLIIDEIHYMLSYAGFASSIINPFFQTIDALRVKFPKLRVIYLTATPAFLSKFIKFRKMNCYYVNPEIPKSKPKEIKVVSSLTTLLKKEEKALVLFPSKKKGLEWSKKYKGSYISADVPTTNQDYQAIIQGNMPEDKVFCSTVLSTGLSINEEVNTVYTSWLSILDIVQMSSRPRPGMHTLIVQRNPLPWLSNKIKPYEPEEVDWETATYEEMFKYMKNYEVWFSVAAHRDGVVLKQIIETMLYQPIAPIAIPDYILDEWIEDYDYMQFSM